MLIITIFSLFCVEVLIGFFALDLLWQTQGAIRFLLKLSASIGLGMGGSSLAYFIYLIPFAGQPYFIYFELLILLALFVLWYRKHQKIHLPRLKRLTLLQTSMILLAMVVFFSSLFGLANYALARQEGDWDAWMIYNRSARFIYRGSELWQNTFSNEIDTFFHPDYPPMLALNIASLWDTINVESRYVPMIQGLFFSISCMFVLVSALASLKSYAQAGLGLIFLWGTGNFFVYEGGRQMADIPLAFFMLTSITFFYLYVNEKKFALLAISGFSAGLAAWTKNEGVFFILASIVALLLVSILKRSVAIISSFLLGSALPVAMTIYFKLFLSPSSEFLKGNIMELLLDFSRHRTILEEYYNIFLSYGPQKITGFLPLLILYTIIMSPSNKPRLKTFGYALGILATQLTSYYSFYLISPYDLDWHIHFSIGRLFTQIYPIIIFTALCICKTPEEIFSTISI